MTGIDLLVGMMLMGCVESEPIRLAAPNIEATIYECPLIGDKAVFTVIRKSCSADEKYAVAIRDQRNGKGFYLNEFSDIGPAYVEVAGNKLHGPKCSFE